MYHFNNGELLVAVLALLLTVVLAVRAIVGDRKEGSAARRNYFDSAYHRELLRHSDLSESEEWRADRHSRFTPFRLRDSGVDGLRTKASSARRWDRDAD